MFGRLGDSSTDLLAVRRFAIEVRGTGALKVQGSSERDKGSSKLIKQKSSCQLCSGTDLRIGQIGHGLGPRAFGGPAQRSFL